VKRPSILIVDDEKSIADTLAMIMQDAGYSARAAYNGAAALTLSREQAPDLVISDVLMPGMSGVDLAVTTKREFPSCRILLFSGQAASADMLRDARGRGYDFELLAKPIDPDELLQKLTAMFG
jgi:CheY-like chemotaxis protein